MQTSRELGRLALAAVVIGAFAGHVDLIGQAPSPARGSNATQQPTNPADPSPAPPVMLRGSRILDMRVESVSGEELGGISDLAVRLDDGRIAYAVVRRGSALGFGGTHVAVAWEQLDVTERERVILNMTPEQLDAMAEFDMNMEWPLDPSSSPAAAPNPATASARPDETRTTTSRQPAPSAGDTIQVTQVVRGSKLIGLEVRNAMGEDLGHIDDLAVRRQDGRIAYTVVAHGGVFGINDDYVAVPLDQLRIDATEGVMILDATPEALAEAPAFEGNWPESVDTTFGDPAAR